MSLSTMRPLIICSSIKTVSSLNDAEKVLNWNTFLLHRTEKKFGRLLWNFIKEKKHCSLFEECPGLLGNELPYEIEKCIIIYCEQMEVNP